MKIKIEEIVVVEGRDDTCAVKRAVNVETIETHGFGIRQETWELLEKAYERKGLIIFTDPDYSGEEIRRRLTIRFPRAKQAFLDRDSATCGKPCGNLDVGIENGSPEAIAQALSKARGGRQARDGGAGSHLFSRTDMQRTGLCGAADAATRRQRVGKILGIGYGNSKSFLRKLNQYGITKEEFNEAICTQRNKGDTGEI